MFVRWKKRKKYPVWESETILLSAQLVKCERIGGKPRQRIVACLASISECELSEFWSRFHFWNTATRRLDSLALDVALREKVERALLAVVVRPTDEEHQIEQEDLARRSAESTAWFREHGLLKK